LYIDHDEIPLICNVILTDLIIRVQYDWYRRYSLPH